MADLAICTFKYKPHEGYRSKFEARHVNILRNMFERHLSLPHEFVCITDDPEGLDPRIRYVPIWDDFKDVPNPHGNREPRCYRRLKMWSRDIADIIGARRFAQIDLDVVLTGDVTPIFDRPDPIVLLPTPSPNIPFNGSLQLMTAGAAPEVWEEFNPAESPERNKNARCYGSDQGQISYHMRGKSPATWRIGSGGDGVYFYGRHLTKQGNGYKLPADARLVSFHGRIDPWSAEAQSKAWVVEHYR